MNKELLDLSGIYRFNLSNLESLFKKMNADTELELKDGTRLFKYSGDGMDPIHAAFDCVGFYSVQLSSSFPNTLMFIIKNRRKDKKIHLYELEQRGRIALYMITEHSLISLIDSNLLIKLTDAESKAYEYGIL